MKLSEVLSEKEIKALSDELIIDDLNKDFSDDEWEELVDQTQDKAAELLQKRTTNAIYIDDIAAKVSAYEY